VYENTWIDRQQQPDPWEALRQGQARRTQRNALSLFGTDPLGAEQTAAQGGDLQTLQALRQMRMQNETQQRAQAQEAEKRKLEFVDRAVTTLEADIAKGEDPVAAFSKHVDGWKYMGADDGEIQQFGAQLQRDPGGFLSTLRGKIAEKKAHFEKAGADVLVYDESGRLMRRDRGPMEVDPAKALYLPDDQGAGNPLGQPQQQPQPQPQQQSAPGNPRDIDALSRMIATEAIGEGPQGMAAAGAVAMNRARSGYGGAKSIYDVVNAPHQFEGMGRAGQVSPQDYARAQQVAQGLVGGQIPDPTGGAINFLNPDLQAQLGRKQPSWAPQGKGHRIGRHVFYGGQGGSPLAGGQGQNALMGAGEAQQIPGYRLAVPAREKAKGQWRASTPEEKASIGLTAGDAAQTSPEGKVEPLSVRDASKTFDQENKLRTQFGALPAVKNFAAIQPQIEIIHQIASKAAQGQEPTAQDDIALIFSFMKMLDPTSVVREGEFATAQNSAGVPDRIRNAWNNLQKGTRLSANQRNEFFKTATIAMDSFKTQFNQQSERYRGIAQSYGLNPDRIIAAPRSRPQRGGQTGQIPKGAVDMLRSNPKLRGQFDAKFGAGSAAKVLGR
jgi:hypothetical protein